MIIDIDSIFSFHQLGERENQEDARYPDENIPNSSSSVFVVCDGVGGCEKGEIASSTVCKCIGNSLINHKNTDQFTDIDLKRVLGQAYKALDDVSNKSNKGMGTTLTFVIFHSNGILAAHIGDSRIYQIRPGEGIMYRSEDHSLVNSLLRSGNISPDKVKDHPRGNVITRCMSANDGTRERDNATVINIQDVAPGDYFLLCTDGVYGMVDEDELLDIYFSELTDEEKYLQLSERCKNSSDNNTAIQIHIGLVTLDPIQDVETNNNDETDCDEENIEEDTSIKTQKLTNKQDSVYEVSSSSSSTQSIFQKLFNKLFK